MERSRNNQRRLSHWTWLLLATLFVTACTPPPPYNQQNICSIFRQYPSWYWSSLKTQKKWGVPISVQMAILHQESHFRGGAQPPRRRLLGLIPWKRPTTAYGYSQALDGTWHRFQQHTKNPSANRSSFGDASNFVGWYANRVHYRLGIPKSSASRLYLAYHEGMGGYSARTYKNKAWLIAVSQKVQRQANLYHNQLLRCQKSLPKKPWWRVW